MERFIIVLGMYTERKHLFYRGKRLKGLKQTLQILFLEKCVVAVSLCGCIWSFNRQYSNNYYLVTCMLNEACAKTICRFVFISILNLSLGSG